MSKGTVLYYAVGPVHPRNMQLIASQLPDWDFHMAYEPSVPWFTSEQLAKIPFPQVGLIDDQVPCDLDAHTYSAVIFSTTQPRSAPMNLLSWALRNRLPTIAIEESNQLALNNCTVNNYLLPVDHVFVASAFEREHMIAAGVPQHRIHLTGWPFYLGPLVPTPASPLKKTELGLDPNKRTSLLILTKLNDVGETPQVRRRQFELLAAGLPSAYQLVVKPHPIEDPADLMAYIRAFTPNAKVLSGALPIHSVLDAVDIVFNRGVSQVAIEALIRSIPVVVLDTGDQSPFHSLVPQVVLKNADDISTVLGRFASLDDPMAVFRPLLEVHLPYSPPQSLREACGNIERISEQRLCDPNPIAQWGDLAMYHAWKSDRRTALTYIDSLPSGKWSPQINSLRCLLARTASRDDLLLLQTRFAGSYLEDVLRCLWVDCLLHNKHSWRSEDNAWLNQLPSKTNPWLFFDHCLHWMAFLLSSGKTMTARDFSVALAKIDERYSPMTAVKWEAWARGNMVNRVRSRLARSKHQMRTYLRRLGRSRRTAFPTSRPGR